MKKLLVLVVTIAACGSEPEVIEVPELAAVSKESSLESVPGPQGEQGEEGPEGPQGLQGEPGTNGADGEQGEDGAQGLPGADGAPGVMGLMGLQGTNGTNGIDGAKGDQGDPGPQGEKGEQGDPGPAGADGEDGIFTVSNIYQRESSLTHNADGSVLEGDKAHIVTGGCVPGDILLVGGCRSGRLQQGRYLLPTENLADLTDSFPLNLNAWSCRYWAYVPELVFTAYSTCLTVP